MDNGAHVNPTPTSTCQATDSLTTDFATTTDYATDDITTDHFTTEDVGPTDFTADFPTEDFRPTDTTADFWTEDFRPTEATTDFTTAVVNSASNLVPDVANAGDADGIDFLGTGESEYSLTTGAALFVIFATGLALLILVAMVLHRANWRRRQAAVQPAPPNGHVPRQQGGGGRSRAGEGLGRTIMTGPSSFSRDISGTNP